MKRWSCSPTRLVVGILFACALTIPAGALADAGGDSNAGDVWVDTVGAPPGPGHEMDPHLPCADINLWGAKLADSGGTYTIDGWEPSGAKGQAYSSNWSYNQSQGGDQVIDVINVQTLIQNAANNGDSPVNKQGYHFKIQFSQDPQKHKTFWVNCPPPSQTNQPGNTPGGTPGGTPPGGTPGAQPNGTSGQQGVLGERRSGRRHRAHRRHRRHHRVQRQAVLPAFTG